MAQTRPRDRSRDKPSYGYVPDDLQDVSDHAQRDRQQRRKHGPEYYLAAAVFDSVVSDIETGPVGRHGRVLYQEARLYVVDHSPRIFGFSHLYDVLGFAEMGIDEEALRLAILRIKPGTRRPPEWRIGARVSPRIMNASRRYSAQKRWREAKSRRAR